MVKKGMSLVELVIAIVVMGFAVATVPLVLQQTNDNNEAGIVKEIIKENKTKLQTNMNFAWDYSYYDINKPYNKYIVKTATTNADLQAKSNINKYFGRIIDLNKSASTVLGLEAGKHYGDLKSSDGISNKRFDIDDFNGYSVSVHVNNFSTSTTTATYDNLYKDVNFTTKVEYVTDDTNYKLQTITFNFDGSKTPTAHGLTTNIKRISIVAKTDGYSDILLQGFVSNIGESKPLLFKEVK